MKSIILLLLLGACECCLGQIDTNLIAEGEWSAVTRDGEESPALRGRLLVYDDREQSANNHARVYLELQHVFTNGWFQPVEIYYDPDWTSVDLHLEMRDEHNQPVPKEPVFIMGTAISPCWVTLPCDATVRLRADKRVGPREKPSGLEVLVHDGCWIVPLHATNEFYLSGAFMAPTNHPSPLKYHVWRGTLELPKVKITAK